MPKASSRLFERGAEVSRRTPDRQRVELRVDVEALHLADEVRASVLCPVHRITSGLFDLTTRGSRKTRRAVGELLVTARSRPACFRCARVPLATDSGAVVAATGARPEAWLRIELVEHLDGARIVVAGRRQGPKMNL